MPDIKPRGRYPDLELDLSVFPVDTAVLSCETSLETKHTTDKQQQMTANLEMFIMEPCLYTTYVLALLS
jgi:hypothetical protein